MSTRINRLIGKSIAGRYRIVDEIGVGGMGRVFRAMPFDDPSLDVAIKVILRDRQINSEDLLRFQKEAALMSRLNHPNIISFYELGLLDPDKSGHGDFGHGYYIVMEIAHGVNLKKSLEVDSRKDIASFFQIAIQIADALDYTHGKNIVHRDIKPQNIIVGNVAGQSKMLNVKVLDFGIARLAEAAAGSGSDNGRGEFAGTPMYMAPEQSTLMDAPVDHRVDLYSLGCVLYEILTGRTPFTASNREKLEREHVYSRPEALSSLRPDVPPIIEAIVHKLLAKDPRERYQSAFSLRSDLLRAKRRLERKERPNGVSFALAANDRFAAVSASLPLVGREAEFNTLVQSYESIANEKGRSRLAVVKGIAGSGKTRLLSEYRNYLTKRKIRFINCTFSQHENNLPFNALANGFNDYLMRLLRNQPIEAEEVRRRVRTLLGPLAHQVAAVVPGLGPYIEAEATEQSDMNGEEDLKTFLKAFSDFTRCLAVDNHPVVFIFDDLHWADNKSLDLIDQFFSHNNSQRFLLVVGYRSNEPQYATRFYEFLDKFSKLKRRYEEFELKALDNKAVALLCGNILQAADQVSDDLVVYLQKYAQGSAMHIVEMMRILVAQDYIRLVDAQWTYDVNQLLQQQPKFNSIDLVLSRLLDYHGTDMLVLEAAAVVGMSFQFELLMAGQGLDSQQVVQVLERGIAEGFIAQGGEDVDFAHFGKNYFFTHWRARELLYRKIDAERRRRMHAVVAQTLIDGRHTSVTKIIFAVTHHLNSAVANERALDERIAAQCIDFNIAAGREAMATQAWQSSQRYFENAKQQMSFWSRATHLQKQRAFVLESLGDLAALQRRHGDAMKLYERLGQIVTDKETQAALGYKRIKIQLVAGVVSGSIRLLRQTLRQIGHPVPAGKFRDTLNFYLEIAKDLMSGWTGEHRLVKLLKKAYRLSKSSSDLERKHYATKIYELGTTGYLQYIPALAWYFHLYAFRAALSGQSAPSSMVKVVAERAILLSLAGRRGLSYFLLDAAMECASSMKQKNIYGYICLMRAMYIDYLRDRDDEVKINLRAALRYIAPDEERIWYSQALEFTVFRELLKGRIAQVTAKANQVPDYVQTRSWISPRVMAMMLYGLLLSDTRDQIVSRAEHYLARRQEVSGRVNDVFIQIIQTILAFVKGELDKARKFYQESIVQYARGNQQVFLYPFEEDFIGLFALTFPPLFEQEHRRSLMREAEATAAYTMIYKRVHHGENRGAAMLLRARCAELLGHRNIRKLYDAAFRTSKVNDNILVLTLTQMWFGDYLLRSGAKFRNEYLRGAHERAEKLKLNSLTEYIEKIMEQRGVDFRKASIAKGGRVGDRRLGQYRSRLVFEHISHIAAVMTLDTSLEQHLEESLAILGRYYLASRVMVMMSNESGNAIRMVYPYDLAANELPIIQYVEPYVNIRSTLFLPLQDAPWSKTQTTNDGVAHESLQLSREDSDMSETPHSQDFKITSKFADDSTQILDAGLESTAINKTTDAFNEPKASSRSSIAMSALIPLRFSNNTVGVLFLEDVDLSNKETLRCRSELDVYGAQLGMLMAKKTMGVFTSREVRRSHVALASYDYNNGASAIEEVSWLSIWSHGRMRAGRESGWYLGMNFGENHYLLIYGRFNGPAELRERLSTILWYQLQSLRTLAFASGRSDFDLREIREEMETQIISSSKFLSLESLSLAFTLFDRTQKKSLSGHFGPSRPVVLCQNNQVTPENRIIATLANGRDLRYWDVESSLVGPHLYLLTHDSSRFDISPSDTQRRIVMTQITEGASPSVMHQVVESLLPKENIPRYYVGAVLNDEKQSTSDSVLPKAQ